jgi:hypothetical protein
MLFDDPALKLPALSSSPRLHSASRSGRLRETGFAWAARSASSACSASRSHLRRSPLVPQPLGQLITAGLAVERVLGPDRSGGLLENPRGDLLVAARRVMGRRRRDLGAVDGDNPHTHQPARAHSSSTPPNSPAIARSCRARKRAIAA